jgi:hypothetical protein
MDTPGKNSQWMGDSYLVKLDNEFEFYLHSDR